MVVDSIARSIEVGASIGSSSFSKPQVLGQGFENLFSELAFYGIALVSTFFMCHQR